MDAKLILDGLRLMQSLTQMLVTYNSTASPAQIRALIEEARARGETIDLTAVDKAISDMRQAGADLDAKIAAAGG